MSDEEFMQYYRNAVSRYSDADFDEFFSLVEIDDPETRLLGKDFVGAAGSFYLMQLNYQSKRASRSETIKLLTKTQKTSKAFAESLNELLQGGSVTSELAELTTALRARYPSTEDRDKDSFKILDAIFPLSANGEGFRYQGMAQALTVLAQCLDAINQEAIKKPSTGRAAPLKGWMILMLFYWIEVKGVAPRAGHYDRETAAYSSQAIAALTFAAQTIDAEISERLVVQALSAAIQSFTQNELEGTIILTRSLAALASSNEAHSTTDALRQYIGMPQDVYDKFIADTHAIKPPEREAAMVTKEEFFETLKSSEFGKMLLQSQVEKNDD